MEHQECKDNSGSYACHCIDGYFMKGSLCADIDECRAESNLCHADGECINTPGSGSIRDSCTDRGPSHSRSWIFDFGNNPMKELMNVNVTKVTRVMVINVKILMNVMIGLTILVALTQLALTMLVVSNVYVTLVTLVM